MSVPLLIPRCAVSFRCCFCLQLLDGRTSISFVMIYTSKCNLPGNLPGAPGDSNPDGCSYREERGDGTLGRHEMWSELRKVEMHMTKLNKPCHRGQCFMKSSE